MSARALDATHGFRAAFAARRLAPLANLPPQAFKASKRGGRFPIADLAGSESVELFADAILSDEFQVLLDRRTKATATPWWEQEDVKQEADAEPEREGKEA